MHFDEVVLTDHAEKKDIPEFQINNILEKGQGQLFFDNKNGSYIRVKGQTIVVFTVEEGNAVVITAYRKGQTHTFKQDRFSEIRS